MIFAAMLTAATLTLGTHDAPSPCAAAAPVAGDVFRGPVLHVLNGSTLCVARGPDPSKWVQLELADVPQGSSRGLLMAVAFAQDVDCRVTSTAGAITGRGVLD